MSQYKSNTKLEIGCGARPTAGYIHQDITKQEGVELDFMCQPWEIPIEDNKLDTVIAVGVMEHLRFEEVEKTVSHIYKLLQKDGSFIFDVPDMKIWSEYLYNLTHNQAWKNPFSEEHIWKSIYGHQRFTGDEHKSGWTEDKITYLLKQTGYSVISIGINTFINCNIHRNRMKDDRNAHLYIEAIK